MIYSEQITNDVLPGEKEFFIERQRNKPTERWYSLIVGLYNPVGQDFIIADNQSWIHNILSRPSKEEAKWLTKDNINNLSYTARDGKHIKKLVKKAQKLGWL